jgi:hypothetical protein
MDDDPDRDLDLSLAMLAEFEENMRLFAERSEKNPWTQGLRCLGHRRSGLDRRLREAV